MRISQLAERCGVPATTLRFYEGAGLLPAERTPTGYRLYGEDAAKHLGLPLEEIGNLLTVWETGACKDVKADLRPRIAARLDEAQQRIAELTAFTDSLHTALDHLDALPDREHRCDPQCGFLTQPRFANESATDTEPGHEAREQVAERWQGEPVACSLSGEDRVARADTWHAAIDGAARTTIDGGLRLTVPAERTAAIAELAAAEQRCCPFFDFRLHLDGPDLHLEVRASAEAAGLAAELFGPPT